MTLINLHERETHLKVINNLLSKLLINFSIVFSPFYLIQWVGGGMIVTTMTFYDRSNHFEGIMDLVKRRKPIEKLINNLLSKLVIN